MMRAGSVIVPFQKMPILSPAMGTNSPRQCSMSVSVRDKHR